MEFEWDDAKRQSNLAKHGLDFVDVERLDWRVAHIGRDARFDYGEDRFTAYGLLDDVLMVVIFTWRGEAMRIVSYRRANRMERKRYGR
jgi:uncharacterized DUF497 family protein